MCKLITIKCDESEARVRGVGPLIGRAVRDARAREGDRARRTALLYERGPPHHEKCRNGLKKERGGEGRRVGERCTCALHHSQAIQSGRLSCVVLYATAAANIETKIHAVMNKYRMRFPQRKFAYFIPQSFHFTASETSWQSGSLR
ncbi:hypothetical protein EVAR_38385_1 [Eumeta japonica]|uniref:Uncharacterized protein n=1 Tax=Eumeta variegata TaxID=151549 RepID=A0A4C1YKE3_EUMVA|nr:hypothetical protein EVAR_38385_1 [Eumeta japonica]